MKRGKIFFVWSEKIYFSDFPKSSLMIYVKSISKLRRRI